MIMKKLPHIYHGNLDSINTNNKKQCIVAEKYEKEKNDVEESNIHLIDQVFSSMGYSFNIPLCIKTQNEEKITGLVAKTKDAIITLENEIIPLSEILSITRKKN